MRTPVKHILVPTDGSESASVGVRYAAAVAQHYGATLHAIFVVDIKLLEGPFLRDVSASLGTAPYVNYQGNISLILEERGKAALDAFRQTCGEVGVACEASQVTGLVPRSIVEKGELADLIIIGRAGEHSQWLDGLVGSTTAAVVRRATRPVLVTAASVPGRQRFMVAYDGSQHAKNALQVAAGMSGDWRVPLDVLAVADKRARPETNDALLDEARSYLEAHELPVEYASRQGDPSEEIVNHAKERSVDLLVMGAFGHTKVRELVVGSTTAYAMNHAPCPLLLTR